MNDGGTTSGGKSLDKTHNNQNLNPNVVAATHNIVLGSWEDPWTRPYWAWTWYTAQRPKYGVTTAEKVLGTRLISAILIDSDFSWIWDWSHWRDNLLIFPMSPRTSGLNVVCDLDINVTCFWIPNWTQIEFRIGLVGRLSHIILAMSMSLEPYPCASWSSPHIH
jgi:hypothetical protein